MSFSYIIRSANKEFATDKTNNCTIRLMGLPQQYKRFRASVVALYVSTNNLGIGSGNIAGQTYAVNTQVLLNSIYELRADSLAIGGIYDTNRTYNTIGFTTNNNTFPQSEYYFEMENANGRSVRFQLYDENNVLLQTSQSDSLNTKTAFNNNWTLVLRLEGIEEAPQHAF
jgi:hypothetical protein